MDLGNQLDAAIDLGQLEGGVLSVAAAVYNARMVQVVWLAQCTEHGGMVSPRCVRCVTGFVIALGHILTEQLKVNTVGTQLFLGTWEYKIPSAYDIPVAFNTAIMKDTPNPGMGYSNVRTSSLLLPSRI